MGNGAKYTDSERRQIVAWFALGDPISLVQQRIKDEFGIEERNAAALWNHYHPNSKECARKWKRYGRFIMHLLASNLLRIPVANKSVRLQMLDEAAREALTWRSKSINAQGDIIEHRHVGLLPAILAEARAEVEGDKPLVDASVHHHYTLVDVLKTAQAARRRVNVLEDGSGSTISDGAVPLDPDNRAQDNGAEETQ